MRNWYHWCSWAEKMRQSMNEPNLFQCACILVLPLSISFHFAFLYSIVLSLCAYLFTLQRYHCCLFRCFLLFRIENCLCIQSWWMMAMKCESVACACVFKWHLEINSRLCDDLAALAPTDHKDQWWYSIYLFSIEEKPYIKHVWMYH